MATATTLYPFVPSGASFPTALAFFAELGFEKTWEHDGYAGLRFGGAYFILQDANVPEWQTNQMIVFEVDDLEAYWRAVDAKNLPSKFSGVKTRPPTDFPWGREVHIIDPGGVCWHVRQRTA
jgi:predicted enzyme related to lactoylglutathione lyase